MSSDLDRERSLHRAHGIIREFVRSASSAAGEDPAALVRLLRHTLPAHFAYEERPDGFFARLERQYLQTGGAAAGTSVLLLDRLRADHREFLDRLDGLETAVARGEDVTAELTAVAERLREHEWIESASAVQVGLQVPADPPSEPAPAGRTLPGSALRAIDLLVDRVRALAAGNQDALLAAITVGVSDTVQQEAVRTVVEEALSHQGLDFVEIVLCPGDGEVVLQDTRFHRLR